MVIKSGACIVNLRCWNLQIDLVGFVIGYGFRVDFSIFHVDHMVLLLGRQTGVVRVEIRVVPR